MSTRQMTNEPRKRVPLPLEYRPGIVRDTWNKVDGIFVPTQSYWVEVPEFA